MTTHPWRLWVAVLVAAGLLVGATVTYSPYRPTGPVVFQPGSVTVPQVTGTTSLFSGLFWPVANHLGLTISGHELARFHATALTLHHTAALRFAHSEAQMHGGQRGHITALRLSTVGALSSTDPDGNDQLVVGHASTVMRFETIGGELFRIHSGGIMAFANSSWDIGTGAGSRPRFLHLANAIVLPSGSVSAPVMAFQAQTTTGFFFPVTGTIAATIAGTERLRLHATALVLATLAGGSNSNSTLTLAGASTGGNGDYIALNAGATEVLRVHANALAFVKTDMDIGQASGSRPNALHVQTSIEAQQFIARIHATTIASEGTAAVNIERIKPSRDYIELTCSDANGCTIIMVIGADADGSGMVAGTRATFVNAGSNTITFSDTAGRSELAGAFASAVDQAITLIYSGTKWREQGRSAN